MQTSIWQKKLQQSFTSIKALVEFLQLTDEQTAHLEEKKTFSLLVPRRIAEKMEKKNIDDPLFKQFISLTFTPNQTFVKDPVQDQTFQKNPKLLVKYQGRALLLCTSACAMHCRYCFRQNFPYETKSKLFTEELLSIQKDSSLKEIILSGGDPLSLSDRLLNDLLTQLDTIEHVRRIRFHTRFPIGIPERIDINFLQMLRRIKTQIIFVVHINHVRELDLDILEALKQVQKLGIPVLNQSVLLAGVNDSLQAQKDLLESLVDHGIMPYYLHQLDRVEGAEYFQIEKEQGYTLLKELQKSLSGYAVPKYVQEIPGELSKTSICE